MERVSKLELAAVWRGHLKSQPRSGLSIEKYCRREQISPGTFYAWKRRLKVAHGRTASRRPKSASRPARRESAGSQKAGGFVHVPLPIRAAIEVRFADGTLVSLPPGDLDALATTLRTLRTAQREGGRDD